MRVVSTPGADASESAGKAGSKAGLADAVSMYRFAGNEQMELSVLREIRAAVVLDPIPPGSDILLLHDMSPLDYSRHNSKADRRKIGNHRGLGYEYVCSLAVDPQTGSPWGVIHDTLINNDGPDDRDVMDYDYEPLFASISAEEKKRLTENHRHQMAVHINDTSSLLKAWHVIDVGDREFDDIFILERAQHNHRDFVIRSSGNRNVAVPKYAWLPEEALTVKQYGHAIPSDYVCVNFEKVIEHVPVKPYKNLPLDGRGRVVEASQAKRFVRLSIGSFKMCLYRAAMRNKKYVQTPGALEVNVVIICETDPVPGQEPLLWILLTSLPVETWEQLCYVGLIYERRWKIETFFKLLKSGYKVLESRLDNASKIARYLVVITLAAMTVLSLKEKIGLGPGGSLSDADYKRVKGAVNDLGNPEIDLGLRLFAFMAKNGGWLGRRADPIGPSTLMRGMLDLLMVLDACTRFGPLIEEALKHPEVLRKLLCV
jgi:hypothetical protein